MEGSVLNSPVKNFPFPILFRADEQPEFIKLERLGGTLTYLLSEYDKERNTTFENLRSEPANPLRTFHFGLFNKVIILFNYVVSNAAFLSVKGFDKFVV